MQRTYSYSKTNAPLPTPPRGPLPQPQTTSAPKVVAPKEPVKLAENRKDREKFDSLAELYSIIYTTERLEKAFIKDMVNPQEYAFFFRTYLISSYETQCNKLISKFKTMRPLVIADVPDVEAFMREYKVDLPAAKNRLLKIGVPATIEHGHQKDKNQLLIAQTTQLFITAMDSLKLEMHSVDQIQPLINDLMDSLNRVPIKDFEQKNKLKNWLITLNQMKAHDELDEHQTRQLIFDLDSSYAAFHKSLADL
jgi:ESCRT-I complex subunit VPS28